MLQVVNKKNIYIAVLMLLFCACDRLDIKGLIMPTGDAVNRRFEQSADIHKNMPVATLEAGATYNLFVCADPHIADDTKNLKEFVNTLRNDDAALFGVVLGDCIDKRGSMPVYADAIAYDAELQKNELPIFSVIGNHDLFFSAWDDFRELVGPSVYWFDVDYAAGKDIFITLDTASGTLGFKQLEWLRTFLADNRKNYRHCVVLNHTNLFYTDNSQASSGNLTMDETMVLLNLFSEHNVTLCLQGHDHYREDLTFGGVRYTAVGTIRNESESPEYLSISLSDSGIEFDWRYIK